MTTRIHYLAIRRPGEELTLVLSEEPEGPGALLCRHKIQGRSEKTRPIARTQNLIANLN